MNKKKVLALVLVLVMLLTAIGGTLAYFTDTDEANNVFTVGNVDIELLESQYYTNVDKEKTPGDIRKDAETYQDAYLGVNGANVVPGRVFNKCIYVDNVGESDAYVRVRMIVTRDQFNAFWFYENTTALENATLVKTIVAHYPGGGTRILADIPAAKADASWTSLEYVYTYTKALEAKDLTDISPVWKFEMKNLDNEDVAALKANTNILVYADAIQAEGFDTVEKAFEAFDGQKGIVTGTLEVWDGSIADDFAGEEDGTYAINTAADLAAFAAAVNAGDDFAGKTVKLNADIHLNGQAWTPIGYGTTNFKEVSFAGTFDGQGHTIFGISINPGSEDSKVGRKWGFFVGIAADGVVKNLNLDNVSFNNVTRYFAALGSLAGRLDGKVENCHVKNVTIDSNTKMTNTGGLIGAAYNNAVIDKCSVSDVTITCGIATDNGDLTAGVVGYAAGDTTTRVKITNTTASNITLNGQYKTKRWAGFIGYSNNTTLENCTVNNLEINVADCYQTVGGFIGDATNGTELKNCDVNGAIINVARVTSGGTVGGFAAGTLVINDTRTLLFENCDVTGLYITAEGNVMGSGAVVGFLGSVANHVAVNNCSVEGVISATAAAHPSNGVVGTVADFAKTAVVGEGNTVNVTIKN